MAKGEEVWPRCTLATGVIPIDGAKEYLSKLLLKYQIIRKKIHFIIHHPDISVNETSGVTYLPIDSAREAPI